MLFRTVYGPELGAIYSFISGHNFQKKPPARQEIHQAFMFRNENSIVGSPQNVDDAISFLKSAGLIEESGNRFFSVNSDDLPFPIVLLKSLRRIETGKQPALHPLDSIYLTLLNELFIKTDQTILPDIHTIANQLRSVQEAGGLGKEKLQSWMRVMEYLGIGKRVEGNFMCKYSTTLVLNIIQKWSRPKGILQAFFEESFETTLPYGRSDGDLARAVWIPMQELASEGYIDIYPLQDSPTRPYFGQLQYRGITRRDKYAQ